MEATCDSSYVPSTVSDSSTRSREEGIQYHLEYYFSEENLSKDRYLKGLMDNNGFVPIAALATFNKMIAFKAGHSDIADAARRSPLLRLDDSSTRIKAYSLDYIVELKGIDENLAEKDVWETILIPCGISRDQCKTLLKSENKWLLYTDDKLAAIDCVGKLRPYEARLRHRVPAVCQTRRTVEQRNVHRPEPAMVNPMFVPVNRFMPGIYPYFPPNMPYRHPILVPFGNRIMFPMPMNEGLRPPNFDSRPQSESSNQNETRRSNHYYTEEARESCDDPFEGFIRHRRPNRGHRQRQSNAAGSWRS